MASENDIIVNLKVEGVDGFKASLKGATQATDTLDASIKRMEDRLKTVPENSKDFKRLSTELEALKTVANASGDAFENNRAALAAYKKEISGLATVMATLKSEGKQGTQVFKDIQAQFEATKKKAGELKDKIGDINNEISALGSDTSGIDNVVRGVSLVANSYQLATGATALFGKENKDLAQALIKINGIMALTQAAQQIGTELTREDSIVKQAASKATALYSLVVGESTGALKLFRLALAATGIGLAILAIGALVANWDKLKEAIFGSTQSLEDFRKKQDEIRAANKQSFDDYETEIKYLVNIKKLTQEAADLKLSIKRKEAEENLKAVYDENAKKLQEYEQAIRNITFAKDDGITMSELEYVRSQQKYIPSQKELTEQKRITKEAELDYKKAVNDRIEADEKGVVVAKNVKNAADDVAKVLDEIKVLNIEAGITNGFDVLEKKIKETELQLESLYTGELASGGTPSENVQIIYLINQLKKLKLELATSRAEFDALLNPSRAKAQPNAQALGGSNKKGGSLFDAIFGTTKEGETRLEELQRMATGAKKIVDQILSYGGQIASVASSAIQIQADNDLAELDAKRKKGIITQKQYEKESAKIKNEAAQKQRAVQIAMAVAQIPQAILSAYISALQIPVLGPTIAPILAAVAGAFAAAQVAVIASSPLPKFRHGGSVAKRLGYIEGAKHEQGGVPIEVEGGEYVIKPESVKRYGVKIFDDFNNMKFNPVITHSKIGRKDNRLNENLVTISSYLKQGYKIDAQGNQILKEIRDNFSKRQVYV
jgi:hypothetical protein